MKKSQYFRCVWMLLIGATILCNPPAAIGQSPGSIERKAEKVKELEEKLEKNKSDTAQKEEALKKAKEAVDKEIEKGKEESKKDPKKHGTNPELQRLRDEVNKLEKDLEKLEEEKAKLDEKLREAEEDLEEEKEKFEEKQNKALEDYLKNYPLPRDKKKLEKLKKDVDGWSKGDWKTPSGEDLKERLKKRIQEEIDAMAFLPGNKQHTVCVVATAMSALEAPAPQTFDANHLQAAVTEPAVFELLMEKLGSEFSLGSPDGTVPMAIEMTAQRETLPGGKLGIRLGRRFELQLGASYYKTQWNAQFPFTVHPFSADQPYTAMGTVSRRQTGLLAEGGMAWYAGVRTVRPYLRAGVRAEIVLDDMVTAQMAGVNLPVPQPEETAVSYAPFGGAGIRIVLWKHLLVETGASYGKVGNAYAPMFELGLGVGF